MLNRVLTIALLILSTACGPLATTEPLFVDVVSNPPQPVAGLSDHIVVTDRAFAEWVAGVVVACERYGCQP